ncbi:hypothetical protein Hanom_Chr03g00181221 [Helianthus anomalus]
MVIQTALWVIWKHRNDAVFHDKQINVARIKEEIRLFGFLWLKNRGKDSTLNWENWCGFNLGCMRI